MRCKNKKDDAGDGDGDQNEIVESESQRIS